MQEKPLTTVVAHALERMFGVALTHEGRERRGQRIVNEVMDRTAEIRRGHKSNGMSGRP